MTTLEDIFDAVPVYREAVNSLDGPAEYAQQQRRRLSLSDRRQVQVRNLWFNWPHTRSCVC